MPKVDLLVCNYNTVDKLKRLLDALHKDYQEDIWDLYVADNDSTDGSREFLKSIEDSNEYNIKHIFYNENIGYAGAINQMANHSSSPYLAALNGDVWMFTGHVKRLADFLSYGDVSIVGPKQRDERAHITHGGIVGPNTKPKGRGWQAHDPDDKLYKVRDKVLTVSGAAYFMKRYVWNELRDCPIFQEFHKRYLGSEPEGAMPSFPHYFEETLISYHIQAHPDLGSVWYDGLTSIGHSWHSSCDKHSSYTSNGFAFGKKYFRIFCDMHGIERD